jgi:PKD repeat protein
MHNRMRSKRTIHFAILASCALLSAAAFAEPLGEGFPYRRPLTVKLPTTDLPADSNIAVAEFYTNGTQKPDGSDIRIVDPNRGVVPSKILEISPEGDFVRVAFEARADNTYTANWGNPNAKAGPQLAAIKRGILAEIYKYPGGPVNTEANIRKCFEKAGAPIGALFVPDIFLAYNPLGNEENIMIRYTSQLYSAAGGSYEFGFTVDDAGFLAIDGKILEVKATNSLQGRVRNPIAVDVKPGWHPIEVTQINSGGQTGVSLVWRKKDEEKFAPLPAGAFAPIAKATDGPLETVGKPYSADFNMTPEAEAFSPPENYVQRYTFEARFPANFKPTLAWDFGDGQTSTAAKPSHIYLAAGNYNVKLTVQQGPTSYTTTRRVIIKDRMYAKFPRPPEDNVKAVHAVLSTYDLKKAPAESALRAMTIYKKSGDTPEYIKWAHAWLDSKETTSQQTYVDEVFDLSRLHLQRGEYKEAADVYTQTAEHNLAMIAKLAFIRAAVMTMCDYQSDAAPALTLAQDWQQKIAGGADAKQQEHTILAAITYAAIAKGDGKLAAKSAEAAGVRREQPYDRQQLQQGVLARDIETYIRAKDFDTATKLIDQWEWEYPEAMIDGFTRLLRVKLLTAEDRPAIAGRIALAHAKALPQSFYAAELLYRASQQFTAAKDENAAKSALDLLKAKYPESPYAREKAPGS